MGIAYAIRELGTLGGAWSAAYAVNDRGVAVGKAQTQDGKWHAVLWDGGDMTDLGVLEGVTDTEAWDINERGDVVGTGFAAGSRAGGAFLWQDGKMHELVGPGGPGSPAGATGINDNGQIVGGAWSALGPRAAQYHAVLWTDIKRSSWLPPLAGGEEGHGWDINDDGLVVGLAQDANGIDRAVSWTDHQPVDLGALGGADAGASCVNAHGQVAGAARTPDAAVHACIWENGIVADLGTLPGSRHSRALDINDHGHVVGIAMAASPGQGQRRAVLWCGGAIFDLNGLVADTPDWELTTAHSLNSHGAIVGEGMMRGSKRGFLLTPSQERGGDAYEDGSTSEPG